MELLSGSYQRSECSKPIYAFHSFDSDIEYNGPFRQYKRPKPRNDAVFGSRLQPQIQKDARSSGRQRPQIGGRT